MTAGRLGTRFSRTRCCRRAARHPAATCTWRSRRRTASLPRRSPPSLVEIHHVVARQPRPLVGGSGGERRRLVPFPVRALHVVVGAQKRVQPCGAVVHVVVRFARRVVALIVLARRRQLRQIVIDAIGGAAAAAAAGESALLNGSAGGPANGALIKHRRAKDVGPRDRTPRRDRRTEIVADDRGHRSIAERGQQRHHIGDFVQRPPRRQIVVERHPGAAAASVAAQVRSDDVEARAAASGSMILRQL